MVAAPGNDDPLTLAIRPPANETPEERAERLQNEERAKQISAAIDLGIKADRAALKQEANAHKILLLGARPFQCRQRISGWLIHSTILFAGQAESGKSTTLKSGYLLAQWSFSVLKLFPYQTSN